MSARGLVLQHGDWGPPGVLGDWARARGIELEIHHADRVETWPTLNGHAFVASLGSNRSPNDVDVPSVAAERRLIEDAVDRDTPVLGLCFGGQMLAAVLGGAVDPSPEPELGWYEITTTDPELVPAGPWLQWHYERITVPPGARQIASSPIAVQAFVHGRHLGVQFHPESTIEIVRKWAEADRDRLQRLGIRDGEALLESGRRHARAAVDAAFQLFDAFRQRMDH
jgi:GMP synthase-like glutamine amidotransferase